MKALFAWVPLGLLIGLVQASRADEPKKAPRTTETLQQLQGSWQVESWEESGKALPPGQLKTCGVFFGANIFVFRRNDKMYQAGSVQLDPRKSPATINFSIRDGEGKDDVMLGIYRLDGDALKLCFDPKGGSRPEDFKADEKSGLVFIALKKPKPAVVEAVEIVGKYRSEMLEAGGKVVVTDVIVEKRGDSYNLTYKLKDEDKILFIGTAIRKGDQLSMAWVSAGQVGVSVYKIEAGPKLVGEYTILGGIGLTAKETLTPWKKID
jgi:uncharacterized protein (TIGR03067 family)